MALPTGTPALRDNTPLNRTPVDPTRELFDNAPPVIEEPNDGCDLSVEVDLAGLEQGKGTPQFASCERALEGNVFLEPTPPELSPWGDQIPSSSPPGALSETDSSADSLESRRADSRELFRVATALADMHVNDIKVDQGDAPWNGPLPRFPLRTPETAQYGDVAPPALPRFSDSL
jgi:hypothetical protein